MNGEILIYIAIGFAAQIIDGSLGMAYGVSGRTFLRTFAGLQSALASAVIHIAEIPASLVSGISHYRIRNVNKNLLLRLMVPGVIGGAAGAWFAASAGDRIETAIEIYLILMGIVILRRAVMGRPGGRGIGRLILPLGLAGGFLDAVGGGGWGPVVTSSMIAAGEDAKRSIGTVNAAEFAVTAAEATAFVILIRDIGSCGSIIAGLVIGSVIAAPLASRICKRVPERPLMAAVGLLIIALNLISVCSH
ncbi:MAG: sulfite exporter TauE/SafE family protein [Lachnospiraceae bacterium]|nr:sulfite exporter TauE/SafE family protein [Lachnospiraceae bacterium]